MAIAFEPGSVFIGGGLGKGGGTFTATFSTTNPNDLVFMFAYVGGDAFVSISDTSNLVWVQRKLIQELGSGNYDTLWVAKASSAIVSSTITVTVGAAATGANGFGGVISGADYSIVFDPNASVPASTTDTPLMTMGTSNANDMLLAFYVTVDSNPGTPPAGWTAILDSGGNTWVGYKIVSAPQSNITIPITVGDTSRGGICDAIMQLSSTVVTFSIPSMNNLIFLDMEDQ